MRKWFKKAAALAVAALLVAPVAVSLNVANADEDVELLPIAKWEFNDEDTKMRDTMGNYDLTVAAIEGGNTANPRDTGVTNINVFNVDVFKTAVGFRTKLHRRTTAL